MQPRQCWQDAYDAQLATWRWIKTRVGVEWIMFKFDEEVASEPFPDDMKQLAARLYAIEPTKLRTASPYYVSAEMCEVVTAAKESFEPEPVMPTDFLTPTGLLYYETPFILRDRNGIEIELRGFSWTPILSDTVESEEDAGMSEFQWEHHNDGEMLEWLRARRAEGHMDGVGLTLYAIPKAEKWRQWTDANPPPLLPMHITPWWFNMTYEGNEVDTQGNHTAVDQWWKLIQTTLRLMQQRLAVRHQQKPTRPQRREAEREGHSGGDVIVVKLRREQSQTPEGHVPSPANYSHRFIVGFHEGGFWRQQHYPSLGPAKLADGSSDPSTHRQIWIAPFEKGPEGAPLVIKPRRVYTWTR